MAGVQKPLFKSPGYYAMMAHREASRANTSSSSSSSSPSSSEVKAPTQPKSVLRRRAPASLFHKRTQRVSSSPAITTTTSSQSTANKGYELVRPSSAMRPYKMTEKHRIGRKVTTITRTIKVPQFLISPLPMDDSCVRKPTLLEELVAKEALESAKQKGH